MAKKKKAAPLPPGFVRSFATTSSQSKKQDPGDEEEPNTSGKACSAPVSEPAAAESAPDAEQDALVAGEDYDTRVAGLKVDADTQRFEKRKKAVLADPSVPALVLSEEAEKALTDFVARRSIVQSRDWFAPESSEPSSRVRLHTAYLTLEKLGFSPDAIENAMSAVGGHNISAMLDWLCLSLPLAQLPAGFTDKKEPVKAPTITYVAPTPRKKVVEDKRVLGGASARKQDTDLDMKSWILNNAGGASSDSDSETSVPVSRGETPSQRYARLFLELDALKHQSALAKAAGDMSTKKELQAKIRTVRDRMEAAETEPGYKEKEAADLIATGRVERVPVPKKLPPATPPVAVIDNETQDVLNAIFDDISPPASTPGPKQPARKLDLPIPKDWTGKTPKQLLQEWINRKARGTVITYYETPSPRGSFRAGVRFSGSGKVVLEPVEPEALYHTEKKREAEELAATAALYKLASNLPLHSRLPPAFKALWLQWVSEDEQKKFLAQEEEGSRRMAFVESFFEKREARLRMKPQEQGAGAVAAAAVATGRNALTRAMDMSRLHSLMQERAQSRPYKKLFKQRSTLPVFAMREAIMDVIRGHRVIVVSGETGSGKSTQIPQFIVEDGISRGNAACRVVCTQPRRISATSIASRVSEELGDPAGHVGRDGAWVGYQVRLENRTNPDTLLTFCTVGILLKRLESDHDLTDVTHVVVDEVHERSIDSDFLILCLKRVLERRADLTVVLMSATADADRFASYFERITGIGNVPCLHVPGRTFPVTTHFLEDALEATRFVVEDRRTTVRDAGAVNVSTGGGKTARVRLQWDSAAVSSRTTFDNDDEDDDDDDELVEEVESTDNWQASDDVSTERSYSKSTLSTVELINPRQINFELLEFLVRYVCANANAEEDDAGSVLVFLPGIGEIKKLRARLEGTRGMWLLDLHSTLSTAEQAKVFERAPKGQTKVVMSTNIAETGITIPDVTVVIDTLRAREVQFDRKRNVTRLTEILISKANAMQRRGRAGRVREGVCWHLVTRKQWERLPNYRPPEMVRVPLEEVCLRVRACRFEGPVVAILNGCVDAPPEKNIERAVEGLTRLNAFTSDERLTPLGQKLCHLPLDVRLGKMLLTACALRCVDPVLTIAAVLSGGKSPFPSGGSGERWREFVRGASDLLMAFRAYNAYRQVKGTYRARKTWCESKDLSFEALSLVGETRSQILRALLDCGAVATVAGGDIDPAFNKYADDLNVVSSAIAAGSFPNVFLMQPSPPATDEQADTTPVTLYLPGRALPLYRLHRTSALVKTLGTAGVKELQGKGWGVSYNVRAGDIGVKTLTAGDFTGAHPIGIFAVAANDIDAQHRVGTLEARATQPSAAGNIPALLTTRCYPRSAAMICAFAAAVREGIETAIRLSHPLDAELMRLLIDVMTSTA
ncbi:ATP-dependent RNA helicase dhx29 [Geranomyces variabilis]|nr:ATP-dependent RNA helicase dhx29 [Geranomyces variabilis]